MTRTGAALGALAVVVGLALGIAGYTFVYARGASYLTNDPAACANCHIMREHYDGWQKASHHARATCNDCHVPKAFLSKYLSKAENGWWHSKGFTLQDFHEPIRIRESNKATLNANCRSCHQTLVEEILSHSRDAETRFDCVRCHANVGHGPAR
jgi:cytochrome c nitrite reductase small subunit